MKKGVALLWVLILSIVFLTLSGTMVGYMVKESQSTIKIQESTKAYTAAKTGIEWALYYLSDTDRASAIKTTTAPKLKTVKLDAAEADVVIVRISDDPRIYKIESTGVVNRGPAEVKRKIEQETNSPRFSILNVPTSGTPDNYLLASYEHNPTPGGPPIITDLSNTGSFDFVFDFWGVGGEIGIRDATGSTKLFIKYGNDGYITLNGTVTGSALAPVKTNATYLGFNDDRHTLKAKISYLRDNAVTLTLFRNHGTDEERGCKEVLTIPISQSTAGIDLDRFYANSSPVPSFDSSVGYPASIKAGGTYATFFMLKK